jgi:hypothetical protein
LLLFVLAVWGGTASAQVGSNPGGSQPAAAAFTDGTAAAGITNQHHKPILDHQLDNIMS